MEQAIKERNRIVDHIRRWGGSVAEAILDPSCKTFSHPETEGIIIYRENGGCAVVMGDPVCPPESRSQLITAFHLSCEKAKKNIIYLITSEEFAIWMRTYEGGALIEFGEELILNPQNNPKDNKGACGRLLRKKLRIALQKGLNVKEYHGNDLQLEAQITELGDRWLRDRKGLQVFIAGVRFFADRQGKRWFYTKQKEKIVGALALNQMQSKQGWAVSHVVTSPDAPPGTSELLIISVLELLAKEGCSFVTVGAIPAQQLGEIVGFGKLTSTLARHTYNIVRKLFKLDGKKKYWEKFAPQSTPAFLIFKRARLGVPEMKGLMRALNISFSKN